MKKRAVPLIIVLCLAAYLGSYLWLSRRAYADARFYESEGFYYAHPGNTLIWRTQHFGCCILFWPLNVIDQAIGFGMAPSSAPLMDLSENAVDSDGIATMIVG